MAQGPCGPPVVNPVACENTLPGSPASQWDVPTGTTNPNILGFATDISVNVGGTINFKINTAATAYQINIYRIGYYSGQGARFIATVSPSVQLPQNQPACLQDTTTGLVDCGNWQVSASWTVPATAVSGVYVAKIVGTAGVTGASHIIFVVRNDSSNSRILYQTSDTTWQAYNLYGGNSLYAGSPAGRAYKVSYNRPVTTRDQTSPFVTDYSSFFNAEYPMVRWLEANGYDVSYSSGVDSDRNGSLILNHRVFLSVGHDEYWSGQQRANVQAALAAGVHLAFFSGNQTFWKTRWENSTDESNQSYRTLVCYKETEANAVIDPLDPPTWTGTWRDPRFSPPADGNQPENALAGTIFMVNGARTDSIVVPDTDGKMRFWRNTSVANLSPGATYTAQAGTLGYEWNVDMDNGFRPPGLFHLSTATYNVNGFYLQDYGSTYGPGVATHNMTLYRYQSSGAIVFSAGTVQWSWGLDGNHDLQATTPDVNMQQATVNLLADMGVQPAALQSGLTAATQSIDTVPPQSTITSPTSGSAVSEGSPLTISGTAQDFGGGVVGGIEISLDGGETWHPASGRSSWSYAWTPGAAGNIDIKTRAVDDSGNLETPGSGITLTVGLPPPPPTPSGLAASAGSGIVVLSWTGSDSATGYNVKRSTISGGPYSTIASGVTATSYADTYVTNGTTYYYVVSAVNASGESINSSAVGAQPNAGISGCPGCMTIWNSAATPAVTVSGDTSSVELGVVFSSDVNGSVYGVRFYKGAGNTGTHIGNLWNAAGANLARATFSGETASGWQQVLFSTPVAITANTNYVASYFAPKGNYADDNNYFGSAGVDTPPLHALSNAAAEGNGLYVYASSTAFPTKTYQSSNYWVDVIFNPQPSGPPPAPTGLTAAGGNAQVTLQWTASVGAASYNVKRAMVSGGPYTIVESGGGATSYTDTGLTNGTTYYYVVSAVNATGESPNSTEISAQPNASSGCSSCITIWSPSATPAVPQSSDGNSLEIGLVFRSDVNGTAYGVRFYKSLANVGTHIGNLWTTTGTNLASAPFSAETASGWQQVLFASPVAINANTNYVVSYFAPHGSYAQDVNYFASAGVDTPPLHALSNAAAGGNGLYAYGTSSIFPNSSYQASNYWVDLLFNPQSSGPSAPTGLAATPGNSQVTLSWTASAGASSYNVKRAMVSGGPYSTIASGVTNTSYPDNSVTNGTLYYYVVSAVAAGSESANSTQVSARPGSPPAPTGLNATSGIAQVSLSWTASSGASSYNVKRAIVSGGPYTTIQSGVSTTSYLDTSVTNGTTYYYVVSAVNGVGESANSTEVSGQPLAVPQPPSGLTAMPGNAQVNLAWTASAGATSYNIKRATVSGGPYTTAASGVTSSTYTNTSLTNGKTYYFVVSAVSGAGESANSTQVSAQPVAPPATPAGLQATAANAQVSLSWNASPTATSYNVKRATVSGGPYTTIFGGLTTTTYVDTTVTNGITYYFVVSAVNVGGESANSKQVSAQPVSPPPAPTGLTATPGNAQVSLSWTASAGANSYNVKRATVSGGPYVTVASGVTATTYLDTTLTNLITYYYVVSAVNAGGEGSNSTQASAQPIGPPPPPTGLTATPSNSQISLNWSASSGAINYNVKRAKVSGGPYKVVASGVTATSYTDQGLTNGTTYYYVVSSANAGGESANSTQVSTQPIAPPTTPGGFRALAGNAQVNVSWNASSNAISYNVKRSTVSGGPYTTIASGVTSTSYLNTGLTNGTTYYYVVSAVNAGGESANSAQASAQPVAPPVAPTGLTATATANRITLSWNGSSGAISYNVKRSTLSGGPYATIATGVTATAYRDTSISRGTTYYYVVSAVDAGGESSNSNQASANTP